MRPVCLGSVKHMRLVISIATAPHPYYRALRHYATSVTPAGWFTPDEGGMPRIWFQHYASKSQIDVKQHVDEREIDGTWFFDDDGLSQCWLGTAQLQQGGAYSLHIEGSERSYQAVFPGPCPPPHAMFFEQWPGRSDVSADSRLNKQASAYGNATKDTRSQNITAGSSSASAVTNTSCNTNSGESSTQTGGCGPVWMAPVQKVVFARRHMAYITRQHLEYHLKLGMAGMLFACDPIVCLELLQDPALAQRANEGRLVLWAWVGAAAMPAERTPLSAVLQCNAPLVLQRLCYVSLKTPG